MAFHNIKVAIIFLLFSTIQAKFGKKASESYDNITRLFPLYPIYSYFACEINEKPKKPALLSRLISHHLLQFLIHPTDGQPHHVIVIPFDALHMNGKIPLNAIRTGLIHGISTLNISFDILFRDRI